MSNTYQTKYQKSNVSIGLINYIETELDGRMSLMEVPNFHSAVVQPFFKTFVVISVMAIVCLLFTQPPTVPYKTNMLST